MKIFYKYKKEILISVGTGIFLLIIEPLLTQLGKLFVKLFIKLNKSFSDNVYKSIALDNPNEFDEWSYFLVIVILFFIIYSIVLFVEYKRNSLAKNLDKSILEVTKKKESLNSPKELNELTPEDYVQEIDSLLKYLTDMKDKVSLSGKRMFILLYSFIFIFFLLQLINYSKLKFISNENIVFKNNIIRISPFIEDKKIKIIQSNWASMENREDYDRIISEVNNIKKENGIK